MNPNEPSQTNINSSMPAKSQVSEENGNVAMIGRGSEQVTIKPSGRVTGDIRAPRVVLNDGCQFKGLVDMEDKPMNPAEPRNPVAKPTPGKPFPERPLPNAGGPTLARRKV